MDIAPVSVINKTRAPEQLNAQNLRAKHAAEQFEAVMLSQSFSQMFKGVKGPSVAGSSQTEKVWQSLMVDEMAKGVAKSGGIGLAEKIYKEMVR